MENNPLGSSYRDPSGYVFTKNGTVYRRINSVYTPTYSAFMKSGLYEKLIESGLLIPHKEIAKSRNGMTIKPEQIPFISYPYEWCFSELKDAALTTLVIQKLALSHGFILKDASAFNIQFYQGKPILIDTLSFEEYDRRSPWVAYRQFCMHFVAPLLLMSYSSPTFNSWLQVSLDGIPLALASRLLPKWTYLNPAILTHIHLHAGMESKYAARRVSHKNRSIPEQNLKNIVESLDDLVHQIRPPRPTTPWTDYYDTNSYSRGAFEKKKAFVRESVARIHPKSAMDVGCNTGIFSDMVSARRIPVLAVDRDSESVDSLYRHSRKSGDRFTLPLVIDITNPSPALGWKSEERQSFLQRAHVDMILALAIVHHLAIGNNVPLPMIAQQFAELSLNLIVEFVPKEDARVSEMLGYRRDIFQDYSTKQFEAEFSKYFKTDARVTLPGSSRILYRMHRKLTS